MEIKKEKLELLNRIINGEKSQESKDIAEYFFGQQELNAMKKFKKKHVSEFINDINKLVEFVYLQYAYHNFRLKLERKKAWDFINNEEESEKAGFVNENDFREGGKYWDKEKKKPTKKMPKQSDQQIAKWAEKAYPNIDFDKWDKELNNSLFKLAIKE